MRHVTRLGTNTYSFCSTLQAQLKELFFQQASFYTSQHFLSVDSGLKKICSSRIKLLTGKTSYCSLIPRRRESSFSLLAIQVVTSFFHRLKHYIRVRMHLNIISTNIGTVQHRQRPIQRIKGPSSSEPSRGNYFTIFVVHLTPDYSAILYDCLPYV